MYPHETRFIPFPAIQQQIHRCHSVWSHVGIQTKILVPLILLMFLSIIGSAIGFIISTHATHDRILEQQLDEDRRRILSALRQSEQEALESARLLAKALATIMAEEQAGRLRNESRRIVDRVVPVRDRFKLDQIIVTNAYGKLRANVAPSHLEAIGVIGYDLLPICRDSEKHLVNFQGARLLVVCTPVITRAYHSPEPELVGNIYTILDLKALLQRIRRDLELVATPELLDVTQAVNYPSQDSDMSPVHFLVPLEEVVVHPVTVVLGDATIELSLTIDALAINEIIGVGFRVTLFSSAFVITVSTIVVALLIRLLLTAPLTRLTTVAEQVAAGDLYARAKVATHDEIGRLAATFNSTTEQLQELIATLEQRVKQRTLELTVANEQLRQEISERTRAEAQIRYQQQELERLASTDDLTSLYNRRHFFILGECHVQASRQEGYCIAAILLDIDHSKDQ